MIKSKKEYKEYLSQDFVRNPMRWYDGLLYNENYYIRKYLKALRMAEYYKNTHNSFFAKFMQVYSYLRYKKFCNKYKINIGLNTCGPGIRIAHLGFIIIGTFAKIGKNLTITEGVVIGTKNTIYEVATIGDNVNINLGAKIIGDVKIGNNVIIAPNSVVVKDVPDNAIVSGIPAKIIKIKENTSDIPRIIY